MAIVNIDVKSLEVVCAAWMSQDKVLCQELRDEVDIHGENQKAFNLPERVVAKTLIFRILFGGTEHGFVKDSAFTHVSSSKKYWANVIEKFYNKYSGLARWHDSLLQEVGRTGRIITPFGRIFTYTRNDRGDLPAAPIKNYIVQGTGADIVSIARVSLFKKFKDIDGLLINTVHDSIVFDCKKTEVDKIVNLTKLVFEQLPSNITRITGVDFNLPIKAEVSVGNNQKDLTEIA